MHREEEEESSVQLACGLGPAHLSTLNKSPFFFCLFVIFRTRSQYVALAGIELTAIPLPLPPKYWQVPP
jgi:hypothetical protein